MWLCACIPHAKPIFIRVFVSMCHIQFPCKILALYFIRVELICCRILNALFAKSISVYLPGQWFCETCVGKSGKIFQFLLLLWQYFFMLLSFMHTFLFFFVYRFALMYTSRFFYCTFCRNFFHAACAKLLLLYI